jgi:glycerophosphoryl diester phosphodiesterase
MTSLPKKIGVIAHRGGSLLARENSLTAFKTALALGVDGIELDVQLSADQEVVVYHDFTINPSITVTREGKKLKTAGPILSQMTLEDLDSFRLTPLSSSTSSSLESLEKIPTLKEVLELVYLSGNSQIKLFIELKTSPHPYKSSDPYRLVDAVLECIEHSFLKEQVLLLSFDWRCLIYAQTQAILPMIYITQNASFIAAKEESAWFGGFDPYKFEGSFLQAIKEAGGAYWSSAYNQVTTELMDKARTLGLKVNIWTPNTNKNLETVIALGADDITTDRPDLLLTYLKR